MDRSDLAQSNLEFLFHAFLSGGSILSEHAVLSVLSVGILGSSFLRESGILADTFVSLSVQSFNGINFGGLQAFSPLGELLLEVFLSLFLELIHVVVNMNTENTVSVDFSFVGVIFVLILVGTGETFGVMGDVHTTIDGSFKSTENTVTSGGGHQTEVQDGLEGMLAIHIVVDHGVVLTVDFSLTFVLFVQFVFLEKSTGTKETSGISSGIVGQTAGDTEFLEFSGLGLGNHLVTFQCGEDNLADNFLGGDTGHKSIFGSVVFILILHGKTLTGVVVSLAFSSSSELGLEALEIGIVLVNFDESHKMINKSLLILNPNLIILKSNLL